MLDLCIEGRILLYLRPQKSHQNSKTDSESKSTKLRTLNVMDKKILRCIKWCINRWLCLGSHIRFLVWLSSINLCVIIVLLTQLSYNLV